MTSQTEKQMISIHTLLNISRSKDNYTMKFGQLIGYIMRNTFLEKSYTKYGEETSPLRFSRKSKFSIFLNQQSKVSSSLFLLYVQVRGYRNIMKLRCRPLVSASY